MSFTSKDVFDSMQYAINRTRLTTIKYLHEKYPHIGSHLLYTVRRADYNQDYYFPSTFAHRAIVTEIQIGKILCEKISCTFSKPNGACSETSPTQYYRVGDRDKFEKACQPACFHLTRQKTFNEDGLEVPQMSRTIFHNNNCVFVPTASIWSELPLFRSTEIYETRVNDLPVGFSDKPNPLTFSGIAYEYNKPYCDSFFDSYDPVNRICYTTWWEKIINAVIGENIMKMTKAGITALQNNGNTVPNPNLPEPPPMETEFLLDGWLNDINENFIIPDPDMDAPSPTENFNEKIPYVQSPLEKIKKKLHNKYKHKLTDIDNDLRRQMENGVGEFLDKKTKKSKKIISLKPKNLKWKNKQLLFINGLIDEDDDNNNDNKDDEKMNIEKTEADDNDDDEEEEEINDDDETNHLGQQILDILTTILQDLLTDPMFVGMIAIDIVLDRILHAIKNQAKSVIERLIPRISSILTSLSRPIGSKLLGVALKSTISKVICQMVIKIAGQLMIALARIIILASSIIGILLIIVTLFDIILSFWDPLGFNNKYPPEYLSEIMFQSDFALRQQFQMTIPRIEFEALTTIILTQDEIIQINIESFTWILEYLDVLEINSEGARIDKGELVEFDVLPEVIDDDLNENLAQLRIYTPEEFRSFEEKHLNRWRFSKAMQRFGLILVGISIAMVALQSQFIAIFLFLISFGILLLSILNLEIDEFVNSINQPIFDQIFRISLV